MADYSYSLKGVCVSQGLEEEMVATIALDVLKGLDYMHAHSMLHRDVKVPHLPLSAVFTALRKDAGS